MTNLSEIVAFEAVAAEYSTPVQAAGLNVGLIDVCRDNAGTPAEFRRALTRQLQATLPRTALRSVRADGSSLSDDRFFIHERQVQAAVIEAAHQSPELRAVTVRDRAGRDITEYFGEKRSWMAAYTKAPQLMKSIDGAPVKLPVIM
jgi:hypothetical protein